MRPVKDIFTQNAQAFEELLTSEQRRGQLTRRLLTGVVVLILLMLNVSHCSEQTGIDRTVVASEKTEVNTDKIVAQQKRQIDELRSYRLADSVEIEARNMLIGDLEKTLSYLADSSKLLETKALADIGREVRIDRQYVAAIKDWQQLNVGRISGLADSIFTVLGRKSDTVFLTRTDTVKVVEYADTGGGGTGADSAKARTAGGTRPNALPAKKQAAKSGRKNTSIRHQAQKIKRKQRQNQRRRERKISN